MMNEEGQTLRRKRHLTCRSYRPATKSLTLLVAVLGLSACAGADDASVQPAESLAEGTAGEQFPTVENVVPEQNDDGTWNFSVTMTSPYDSPARYADGWRVVGPDGTEFGTHTLTHDHAAEQPFTRRQSGVTIPDDVEEVTVEGRDLVNGFGGESYTVGLDRG